MLLQFVRSTIFLRTEKRDCVALFYAEADFRAMSESVKTIVQIRAFLQELDQLLHQKTPLDYYNLTLYLALYGNVQGAIS